MEENKPFSCWAMVELMGHQRIAGLITEKVFGSTVMLQVNVPQTADIPEFTRILSFSAIYAINPTTEEVARRIAASIREMPVLDYDMKRHVQTMLATAIEAGKYIAAGNTEDGYDPRDEQW